MKNFLVVTSRGGETTSRIWDSSVPLPLGVPFRWSLEKTEKGLRLRELSITETGIDEVEKLPGSRKTLDLENALLTKTPSIQLSSNFKIKIKPFHSLAPAYRSHNLNSGSTQVIAYHCTANSQFILGSKLVENSWVAKLHNKNIFKLLSKKSKQKDQSEDLFVIIALTDSIRMEDFDQGTRTNLIKKSIVTIDKKKLSSIGINFQGQSWRFALSACSSAVPKEALTPVEREETEKWYRRTLAVSGAALLLLMISVKITALQEPKVKIDGTELIPPQFAKIVLAPPKPASAAKEKTITGDKTSETAKKSQDATVVQALRAKKVQNAVSGLLKGGMKRLMEQSNLLVGGAALKESKKLFQSKTKSNVSSDIESMMSEQKAVKVASVGGKNLGDSAGYEKGERASVQGQGSKFTPVVITNAKEIIVEEGLTKDEVGKVIHKHLSDIRYCYESSMMRNPNLEGKLMARFVIGKDGRVKTKEAQNSTLQDAQLEDCILRRLGSWPFPKPRGGVDVAVSYPFIFKALER